MANKQDNGRRGVLFVCLGNICRSPMAEAAFIHYAREKGVMDRFDVDSCGTGQWHIGERADPRAIKIAKKHGVDLMCIARQLSPQTDFARFEMIIPMDRENLAHLITVGAPKSHIRLLRSYDPTHTGKPADAPDVPDPFFGEGDGFMDCYKVIDASCSRLLDDLLTHA